MIGIYKITNKETGKCYVGQSRNIEKRWANHISAAFNQNDAGYHYPLYCAMRKYGIDSFDFQVLETCSLEELNDKEVYWINKYCPEYNQTAGGNYRIIPQKLTEQQVQEIQSTLINDPEGKISHKQLAEQYHVHKDTIRDINVGRTWYNDKLTYPLHYSKYDKERPEELKPHFFCIDCGKEISKGATRCVSCDGKRKITEKPVTRDELKLLIRTTSFAAIGRKYGVTDNAIRKWCDRYNLPRKATEIKKISDEDWKLI